MSTNIGQVEVTHYHLLVPGTQCHVHVLVMVSLVSNLGFFLQVVYNKVLQDTEVLNAQNVEVGVLVVIYVHCRLFHLISVLIAA